MNYRIIVYHKQATSARTRFLRFSNDSVLAFEPLPALAQLLQENPNNTALHPAAILHQAESRMEFPQNTLQAEMEYQQVVDIPGEPVSIILARIDMVDPPFDIVEKQGASFIDLTQARGLPQVELELLRFAYELILGG